MATTFEPNMPRLVGTSADVAKNHLYSFGGGRLLCTFPAIRTVRPLRRCAAQVLLTLRDEPFSLTVEGRTNRYQAAVIKPRVPRTCTAARAGINVQIDPSHPQFPRFRTIGTGGVLTLRRESFRRFDADLELAYRGKLGIEAAAVLADDILKVVLSELPEIEPLDRRIERVIELLGANPQRPLRELAADVGLSYYRLSHLFVEQMGISLRVFHLWRKVHTAMKLLGNMSIVEAARRAAFADASHLSHAFQQQHGWTPSFFFDCEYVKIIARPRPPSTSPRGATKSY